MTLKKPNATMVAIALIVGGIAAELFFEFYGLVINPALFGFPMEPANLVIGLTKTFLGAPISYVPAYAIHLAIGILGFPLGYYLLRKTVFARLPWQIAGLAWGVILWFIAQGILAPVMGRAFMMDWVPYTWVSLFAHPTMTLIIAGVYHVMIERKEAEMEGVLSAS
ncbi:hypothetical protein N9D37_02040 [Erythrobacter sp.]|nr:hypothetical protein [Erythrobacter sp.]